LFFEKPIVILFIVLPVIPTEYQRDFFSKKIVESFTPCKALEASFTRFEPGLGSTFAGPLFW
jgi:hypothetical protein